MVNPIRRNMLALPGYADTSRYWAAPLAEPLKANPVYLEWPGLWDEKPHPFHPVDMMLNETTARIDSTSIIVSHSFGARIALEAVTHKIPHALVLLAPTLGEMAFMEPESLIKWRETGWRTSIRPTATANGNMEIRVPISFAEDVIRLNPPIAPNIPTIAFLVSDDRGHNPITRQLFKGKPNIQMIEVEGPHDWWTDSKTSETILSAVAEWAGKLETP